MPTLAVLIADHALGFEAMIPGQVFGMANLAVAETSSAAAPYEVRVCTPARAVSTVAEWGGVEISSPHRYADAVGADIVVVPGAQTFLEEPDGELLDVLRAAADRGSRIAAVCVGAFTVAAAGLLDGRRATTHWQWADVLAERYPETTVEPGVLFVDDGPVLTSAGVTSGLDLCLHLVRTEYGADLAARTARRLVLPAWRDGGQAQYIEHVDPTRGANPLQATIDWMHMHLDSDLDLTAIAAQASMSVRSLNRHFRSQVGTTPQALLLQMRVDRARQLLETTRLSVDQVAARAGFGSVESLRRHFVRAVGLSPQRYRAGYVV